jgi:4-amino-4-deoxy-L-arabinose transferase-like glycosyltransferase
MGTQISWLLPAALVLLVAGLAVTFRAPRTNRTRAGLVLWGGWLLVAGAAFSLGQGIIHPYYTVALAPPIGGLVGVGGTLMWANRDRWVARAVMSTVVAVTAVWSFSLLGRTPHWLPWLRGSVLVVGLAGAAGILAWPYVKRPLRAGAAGLALFGGLAAPLAYTLDTVRTPHSGAIPSAGPAGASSGGFGGGPGRGFPGGSRNGAFGGGFPGGNITGGGLPGGNSTGGGFPGANGNGGLPGANGNGTFPGGGANSNGAFPGGSATGGTFPGFGTGRQGGFGPGGAGGGLLDASRPSAAMVSLLDRNASKYTWVAASVGANSAAGYQLATGHAVMAIGGFNGTDPYPTLAEFEKLVSAGKVHYFIGGGGFGGGPGGGSASSSAISSWVESHFTASTVGGVTVYDLTAPSGT